MRISEALGDIKPLTVKFGGAALNIEYRPPAYTVAELEQAQADKENPARLISMIQQMVTSWDLEDETGEPIDLADAEAIRTKVPLPVYNGIVKAIREDNQPGEA